MVDGLTPDDAMNAPLDPTIEDGAGLDEGKKGLFSSPLAKILGIVAAIIVVLGILGVIAVIAFTFFFASDVQDELQNQLDSAAATETASAEGTESVPVEPEPVAYSEIFTFRDIFDPLVIAPITCETSGSAETSSATEGKLTADVSSGTLYLEAIAIEDGASTAVVLYDGTEYRLTEGTGVPGTPWMVLSVNESSVVMLYGDQQVILSVGQGTSR